MGEYLLTEGASSRHQCESEEPKYPMWVMKFEDFMDITVPKSHETYLEQGLIHTALPSDTVL